MVSSRRLRSSTRRRSLVTPMSLGVRHAALATSPSLSTCSLEIRCIFYLEPLVRMWASSVTGTMLVINNSGWCGPGCRAAVSPSEGPGTVRRIRLAATCLQRCRLCTPWAFMFRCPPSPSYTAITRNWGALEAESPVWEAGVSVLAELVAGSGRQPPLPGLPHKLMG